MSEFSGNVVDALNTQDTRNQDLLTQVIDAANEASADTAGDVTIDGNPNTVTISLEGMSNAEKIAARNQARADHPGANVHLTWPDGVAHTWGNATGLVYNGHESGSIRWGGKEASIQGTGGVALLEYAKDAIQTAVSNVSGMGTKQIELKKIIDRKFQV